MATSNITELKRYLIRCPQEFDFKFNASVREDIKKALFISATENGKYLKSFFPNMDKFDSKGKSSSMQNKQSWTLSQNNGNTPSHPGKSCVRKFTKGEPTYRCL